MVTVSMVMLYLTEKGIAEVGLYCKAAGASFLHLGRSSIRN